MKANIILLPALLLGSVVTAGETAVPTQSFAQTGEKSPLQKGFMEPSPESRPELFWDWMHDLVTREGITHDLEAMKRVG